MLIFRLGGLECRPMKFQTRQPQRLLESGRIVSSLDPRDYDTLSAWFFGQRWIGRIILVVYWFLVWLGLFWMAKGIYWLVASAIRPLF